MRRLRAVSLFSNCGAGDVGYRNAGFSFDVMAELDERRLRVALLNHTGAKGIPGDLTKTWPKVVRAYRKRAGTSRPALLSACPPCQGMSSARSGKGHHEDADAGSQDQRNLLVTVIAKVTKRLEPAVVVVENVPAFLTRRVWHPRTGRQVSAANYLISQLSRKYEVFPLIADLCDFGIPQSRSRAFLTFVRKDVPGLKELVRVHRAPFPRPSHAVEYGDFKPITLAEALASFGLPPLDAKTKASAAAEGYGGLHAVPIWKEAMYSMVAAIPGGSGRSAWDNDVCPSCGTGAIAVKLASCPDCDAPLLRPLVIQENGKPRLVRGFKSSYRRMRGDRPAATVTTASGHTGSDNTIHPTENRVLSTLECALLQTFPKDFNWGDALEKLGHTNVRAMVGEAVPPAFTQQHGEVLVAMLRREWDRAQISMSDDRLTSASSRLLCARVVDRAVDRERVAKVA